MPKVWNIGNTTVRNPKRIEKALKVFLLENFSGNAKGSEMERKLHLMLKERQVLDFEGEPSDWNGRKWRAAFYQLGFISYEKYKIGTNAFSVKDLFSQWSQNDIERPYQVTKAGKKLIEANLVPEIEEIYSRQFASYEIPNALEKGFPEGKMKPFILFLQVLLGLSKKGMRGLNKFETGLFIQPFRNHTPSLPTEIIEEILKYREEISNCKKSKELKAVKEKYLNDLKTFSGIDPNSVVKDYSDTTFRYFSLSGLFMRLGETINLRTDKIQFVENLLSNEPHFMFDNNPIEHLKHFYNNSYPLPSDIKAFAFEEVQFLKEIIHDKSNPLLAEADSISSESDIALIQNIRYKLIEYSRWEREEDFANAQQDADSIKDILRYLKALNNELIPDKPEIDDAPAFLEWAVWRSFLAIDEITCEVHKTRRFQIDQDFMPRNTAPGGGSDLIFEFESYILVVEVTLTKSHRQMAVESEPVRRHTVKYKEEYPHKDIYCLFIAPEVDNNVAETFRIGVWYKQDEEEFVNIIPMSLLDFNKTIETLLIKKYRNSDFRNLLDRCLVSRNVRAPQWKKSISKEINDWIKRISFSN